MGEALIVRRGGAGALTIDNIFYWNRTIDSGVNTVTLNRPLSEYYAFHVHGSGTIEAPSDVVIGTVSVKLTIGSTEIQLFRFDYPGGTSAHEVDCYVYFAKTIDSSKYYVINTDMLSQNQLSSAKNYLKESSSSDFSKKTLTVNDNIGTRAKTFKYYIDGMRY